MDQSVFTATLEKLLAQLNREKSIAFGLNLCERLFPNYIDFSTKRRWGNPALLQEAIQYCRDNKTKKQENAELQKLMNEVDINTPDTEDFGDYDGSYALNATASIYELLNFLLDEDKSHLLNISTYMLDDIDFKIAEAGTDLTYEQLDTHPETVKERLFQLQIAM